MKPQITVSEQLFKKLLRTTPILAGLLMAFISFVWDIYKDCNEGGVTLSSINMALIHSIIMGGVLFAVFYFSNRKNWRKIIEDNNTEKTKFQKICSVIILCSAFTILLGGILYANHLKSALFVVLFGVLASIVVYAIVLISKRKKSN